MNPWPLKPVAANRPGTGSIQPSRPLPSGVISRRPARTPVSGASRIPGSRRASSSRTRRASDGRARSSNPGGRSLSPPPKTSPSPSVWKYTPVSRSTVSGDGRPIAGAREER